VSDWGHAVTECRGRWRGTSGPRAAWRRFVMVLMVTMRRHRWRLRSHRLDWQHPPPLLGQFGARLRMRIEQREVRNDHRNRQRYREHAGESAQRADEHSDVRLGRHIAVADRRHRHNGPPQTDRDGGEVVGRVVLDALGVVDERGEDDDADDEKENEKHQFVRARFESVDKDLEPWRMPRQLHHIGQQHVHIK